LDSGAWWGRTTRPTPLATPLSVINVGVWSVGSGSVSAVQNFIFSQLLLNYSPESQSLAATPTTRRLAFGVPAWTLFTS
jgi:hypothetical protein